jgi:hypothetical protein
MTNDLRPALRAIEGFVSDGLTHRIARLEKDLRNSSGMDCRDYLLAKSISTELMTSAHAVKKAAAEINVVIHAVGILLALPVLLSPTETIVDLSLGAGNTGKPFDLETTERIAEFKFIEWRGGTEAIRQNALFKDYYLLAEHPTQKQKYLYVIGTEHPLRFLKGGRALGSVMSRNSALWANYTARYGDRFKTVSDYYAFRKGAVHLEDISTILPAVFTALNATTD